MASPIQVNCASGGPNRHNFILGAYCIYWAGIASEDVFIFSYIREMVDIFWMLFMYNIALCFRFYDAMIHESYGLLGIDELYSCGLTFDATPCHCC